MMGYVDDSIALFNRNARNIFSEYAASYQEKEALYLKGTHFLRIRVLNSLVEMMQQQLKSEMEYTLTECKKTAPAEYSVVKQKLVLSYEKYVSCFRNLNFEIDNS